MSNLIERHVHPTTGVATHTFPDYQEVYDADGNLTAKTASDGKDLMVVQPVAALPSEDGAPTEDYLGNPLPNTPVNSEFNPGYTFDDVKVGDRVKVLKGEYTDKYGTVSALKDDSIFEIALDSKDEKGNVVTISLDPHDLMFYALVEPVTTHVIDGEPVESTPVETEEAEIANPDWKAGS